MHWAFTLPRSVMLCDVAVGYTTRKNSHGDRDDFIVTRIIVISTSNRDNLIIDASLPFLFRYATCQVPEL